MKLEKIISLANAPVRLRFLAMERSLRAIGCDLPLWVIPYDDRLFDLPKNAIWWTMDNIREWLKSERAHPMMPKYQCLLEANYQYVDSDVVLLRDPAKILAQEEGFITSCGHWHNSNHTLTTESHQILQAASTCWQRTIFNAGQFASDRPLFTFEELQHHCRAHPETCLRFPAHDQTGLVLLAHLSGVPVHNLTLPPTCMESTWAGDYFEEGYEKYWRDEARKPYLIHWAGCDMWETRAVDALFTQYLTAKELVEWNEEVAAKKDRSLAQRHSLRRRAGNTLRGARAFAAEIGEKKHGRRSSK